MFLKAVLRIPLFLTSNSIEGSKAFGAYLWSIPESMAEYHENTRDNGDS